MLTREGRSRLWDWLVALGLLVLACVLVLPALAQENEAARARQECTKNLREITMAAKLYQQDNRYYPRDRNEAPIARGAYWCGTSTTTRSTGGYGLGALFPDYMSSDMKYYHCPCSPVTDVRDPRYISYDGADPACGPGGNMGTAVVGKRVLYSDAGVFSPGARLRYVRTWRTTKAGGKLLADPTERRQLIWRNPDAETVLTWCPYHRADATARTLTAQDTDLVAFADGRVEALPSRDRSGHAATP